MDITKLQEAQAALVSSIAEATSVEDVKSKLTEALASFNPIVEEIAKKSAELVATAQAEKNRTADLEKARDEAIAAVEALRGQLATVQTSLSEIQAAQAVAEQERVFNERMASIDDVFEFSDDERALVVGEVKSLDTEAFAAWMDKTKKLCSEKTKEFKRQKAAEAAAKSKKEKEDGEDEEDCECESKKKAAKEAKASENVAAAIESAAKAPVEPVINASYDTDKNLVEQMKQVFANGISIGGRTLVEISKHSEKKD